MSQRKASRCLFNELDKFVMQYVNVGEGKEL